jgi:hypothetical protein
MGEDEVHACGARIDHGVDGTRISGIREGYHVEVVGDLLVNAPAVVANGAMCREPGTSHRSHELPGRGYCGGIAQVVHDDDLDVNSHGVGSNLLTTLAQMRHVKDAERPDVDPRRYARRYAIPRSAVAVSAAVCFALVVPTLLDTGAVSVQVASAILSVILSSVTALWFYARERLQEWSTLWMTPPGLLWISALLAFGLASYYWIAPPRQSSPFDLHDVALATSMVALMVWMSLPGVLGVARRLGTWAPLDRFDGLRERFEFAGPISFTVGTLATLVLIGMGRYSFVGDPSLNLVERSSLVNLLNLASPLALYGAAIVLWNSLVDGSKRRSVVGYGMFAALVLLGLFSGFKGSAIVPAMAVIIIYRIAKGRYPTHLLIGAAIGVVLVFPFNTSYRTEVRYVGTDPLEALSVAATGAVLDSAADPLGVISNTAERLTGRLRLIDSPAAIVARTPADIPYRDAFGIPAEIAAGLIPRSLWPNKPINEEGYVFGQEFFNLDPETYTSIAVTVPGSAFRYGGLAAVVIAGLLMGAYIGVLERVANPVLAPAGLFLFMSVVRPFTALETAIVPLVTGQIQVGLVGIAAMAVLVRRSRHTVGPEYR